MLLIHKTRKRSKISTSPKRKSKEVPKCGRKRRERVKGLENEEMSRTHCSECGEMIEERIAGNCERRGRFAENGEG
jgi:hypothetical protein